MYETLTQQEVCDALGTNEKNGLSDAQARERLKQDGTNILKKTKEHTVWDMIQEQLNDPMIFILFLAASISILLREFSDTAIILAVITLNTTVGVIQEGKAKKAMEALKNMTAPTAIVKRNGAYEKIPADQLVKGDIVKLKAGNQVPADLRLLQVQGLSVNESALTGESLPVAKNAKPLEAGLPMAEKKKYGIYVYRDYEGQCRRRGYSYRNGHGAWENCRYDGRAPGRINASSETSGRPGEIAECSCSCIVCVFIPFGAFPTPEPSANAPFGNLSGSGSHSRGTSGSCDHCVSSWCCQNGKGKHHYPQITRSRNTGMCWRCLFR